MPLDSESEEFTPDPVIVRPTSSGPQQSSDAPAGDTEPHPGADEEANEDRLPKFDPRYLEPFEGLAFLGALTDEFEWLGHTFVIRTLTTDELLDVALIVREYEGTMGAAKAYATAMVAQSVVSVDHKELPIPYQREESKVAAARMKFHHVAQKWYPYTVDAVYERYLDLDEQVRKVLEQMGKASG